MREKERKRCWPSPIHDIEKSTINKQQKHMLSMCTQRQIQTFTRTSEKENFNVRFSFD